MAWMMDTYSMHVGHTVPGVVTGKPISLGGSEGRNEATARGTVYCIIEAARHNGIDLNKARVSIQGFGNAGSIAAKLISEEARRSSRSPTRPAASTTPTGSTSIGSSPGRRSTAPSRASRARPTSRTPRSSRSTATS
jgi:hypothetical protein